MVQVLVNRHYRKKLNHMLYLFLEEMFQLLTKITLIKSYSFELIPESKRKRYVENSEAKIVNDHLKEIVEANTSYR